MCCILVLVYAKHANFVHFKLLWDPKEHILRFRRSVGLDI